MKKEPLRMCLVCRKMLPKKELVRIVKNNEGEILVDKTGKTEGRGAYVCTCEECSSKMKKQKVLNRAFKTEVSEEIYQMLSEAIVER